MTLASISEIVYALVNHGLGCPRNLFGRPRGRSGERKKVAAKNFFH
jgi:hypothetical protein